MSDDFVIDEELERKAKDSIAESLEHDLDAINSGKPPTGGILSALKKVDDEFKAREELRRKRKEKEHMKKDGLTKWKKPTKRQIAEIDLFLQRWYQIGWGTSPKTLTVREAVNTILALACAAHVTWLHRMNVGRSPGEDISPAEGLLPIAYLLEHCASAAKVRSVKCSLLEREFARKSRKTTDRVLDRIANKIHETVPGYLWYSGEDRK